MPVKPVRLAVLGLLISAVFPSGAAGLERFEKTVSFQETVAEGGSLQVENLLGSITIRGGADDRVVRIEARIVGEAKTRAEARGLVDSVVLDGGSDERGVAVHLGFPVERHTSFRPPNGLLSKWVSPILARDSVSVEYDGRIIEVGNRRGAAAVAAHLTVTLPVDLDVSARQILGSIEISSSRGEMRLDVVGGDIVADHLYGTLQARSGRGKIEVSRFTGQKLVVQTSSGNQVLTEVTTDHARLTTGSGQIGASTLSVEHLEVESVSGDVEMVRLEPVRMDIRTDSGQVILSPTFKRTRRVSIHTTSGNVTLHVGSTASFDLLAATRSGRVKTKGVDLHELEPDKEHARYRRGPGGLELEITARAGDVTIKGR